MNRLRIIPLDDTVVFPGALPRTTEVAKEAVRRGRGTQKSGAKLTTDEFYFAVRGAGRGSEAHLMCYDGGDWFERRFSVAHLTPELLLSQSPKKSPLHAHPSWDGDY